MFQRVALLLAFVLSVTLAQDTAPVLSFPVTIGDVSPQLAVFDGQTPEDAVAAFCHRNGLDYAVVGAPLATAVVDRWNSRGDSYVAFTFVVSVDSQDVTINMMNGMSVNDAVVAFCNTYGIDVSTIGAELVGLFTQQIDGYKTSGVPTPEPTPALTFNIPVDGEIRELHHFEGADEVEEVRAFCLSHGFLTDELLNKCVPPLVEAVRGALNPATPAPVAEPLFTMPITIDGVDHPLAYYQGQDPADAARAFLLSTVTGGVDDAVVGQLRDIIVDRATALAAAQSGEAKITPDPLSVARLFCLNRWGQISDAVLASVPGLAAGEQPVSLDACAELLTELIVTVNNRLIERSASPEEFVERSPLPDELFALTVAIAPGQYAELVFLAGMQPHAAAAEFAARHGLPTDVVPQLVGAINDGIVGLNAARAA